MNRLIIAAAALLALNAAIVGVLFAHSGDLAFLNKNQLLSDVSSATAPDTSQSQANVQSTVEGYTELLNDQTVLSTTAIEGEYALQAWGGTNMAGEALLQYDDTQDEWNLITLGGGTWDADELVQEGVPQDTATALVADMSN